MAKSKVGKGKEIILKECKDCKYSFPAEGKLYCVLRLQYKHILKDSGIVSKKDCPHFRVKK